MRIIDCGQLAYDKALRLQEKLAAAIFTGNHPETVLLLEHPPVYTIGRGGNPMNILDPTLRVERVGRGGDVTWHGPGQVVCYPLIDLRRRGRDLHRWVRFFEEVLMALIGHFDIQGYRRPGEPGVWAAGGKIGFVGIGVRRWISMHGCSLNVHPDLAAFSRINPCGYLAAPITSMAEECDPAPTVHEVIHWLRTHFAALLSQWLPLIPDVCSYPYPSGRLCTSMRQAIPADSLPGAGGLDQF